MYFPAPPDGFSSTDSISFWSLCDVVVKQDESFYSRIHFRNEHVSKFDPCGTSQVKTFLKFWKAYQRKVLAEPWACFICFPFARRFEMQDHVKPLHTHQKSEVVLPHQHFPSHYSACVDQASISALFAYFPQ